ncbi:MAG TPA: cytochrome C oxidase subunit IV family protein [Tepidisphaeraceae bacterium]|jgi:cytochrome c oxidase subunit 4
MAAPAHPTVKAYRNVFLALMGLLVLTVAAAFLPLDRILPGTHAEVWARRASMAVALTIAVMKGLLIILYFMHVRYAPRVTWAFAGAAFLWLAIMLTLTLGDYMTRNHPAKLNYRGEPRYLISERPGGVAGG